MMTKVFPRRSLGLAALSLVLGLANAAWANAAWAEGGRIPLRIVLPEGPVTRSAGFEIAAQRGYFTDAGLDVTLLRQTYGKSPVDALADGGADLAVEIMPIALERRAKGGDIVHVAQIFQHATQELVCRNTIDQPQKLAGHNVGIWFDGWESSFYAWLAQLGLSYFATGGGVTLVRANGDADLFIENEVDCLTTTTYRAPLALAALGDARKELITYSYEDLKLGLLEDGIYARSSDLANPARVNILKRFLSAAARGWQSLHDDPSQAEILIRELPGAKGYSDDALAESLAAVSASVAPEKVKIGTLNDEDFDRTILLLMTGAPEPVLTAAPSGAISDVLRQ